MRKIPCPSGRAAAGSVVVTAVFALAACGTAPGSVSAVGSRRASAAAPAISHPASAAAAARHFKIKASCAGAAAAYDVTDAGTAAWAVQLPGGSAISPPVVIDGLAVFGDGNDISALRLTDGSQAWQRTYGSASGKGVSLSAWHDELIAVTGPQGGAGPVRVQALDPATGAVRWAASLGARDLSYSGPLITSGGVLAVLIDSADARDLGNLVAFDLNARRLLWSRPWSKESLTAGPTAVGSVIVMIRSGTATGLDARTGTVRWTRGGMPGHVESVAGPGNLVLLYDLIQYTMNYDLPPSRQHPKLASHLFPVTALDVTTGAVAWRAKNVGGIDEVYVEDGVIIVVTAGPGRLTLLRPSGQVIWSVPETAYRDIPLTVGTDLTWVDTGTDLIYVRDLGAGYPVALVDRRLSDGAVRWSTPLGGAYDAKVVGPADGNLIVAMDPRTAATPPAALAVDPATGQVRATTSLAANTEVGSLTVVGGDTLIRVAASACP